MLTGTLVRALADLFLIQPDDSTGTPTMPPELVILTLSRADAAAARKQIQAGDADSYLRELWADYATRSLACFTCDAETAQPPFTMILPDPDNPASLLACPLCPACGALPSMLRLNRAMKILKRWARGGKQFHLQPT